MPNSAEPDQMSHLPHLIWVYTICSDLSAPKLRIAFINLISRALAICSTLKLNLKVPSKICSKRHPIFFFFFSEKRSLDILCDSSAWQIIHMKFQDFFSLKYKKKSKLLSAEVVIGILRIETGSSRQKM